MSYSLERIFTPNSFPIHTYVSRGSDWEDSALEERLQTALKTGGFLTFVTGPSKVGKTVLCRKAVRHGLVAVSGSQFSPQESIWSVMARNFQIAGDDTPEEHISQSAANTTSNNGILHSHCEISKEEIIACCKQRNLTLLIDDAHELPKEIRKTVFQQLKDAAGKGLKIIIAGEESVVSEVLRLNPDLSGRISVIRVFPWKKEELKKIALRGFEQLGIIVSESLLEVLAKESLGSPQRMQSICLNIALMTTETGTVQDFVLTEEICPGSLS